MLSKQIKDQVSAFSLSSFPDSAFYKIQHSFIHLIKDDSPKLLAFPNPLR